MISSSNDALREQFSSILLDEEVVRLLKFRSFHEECQHFTTTESSFRLRQYLEHQNISFHKFSDMEDTVEHRNLQLQRHTNLLEEEMISGIGFTYADTEFIVYTLRWRRNSELLYIHDLAFGSAGDSDSPGRLLVQEVLRWNGTVNWCISVFQKGAWFRDVQMWDAVQESKWGKLVLDEDLVKNLQRDTELFFANKDLYDTLGIAWRRGIILSGPSGNGKTEIIKVILKECGYPVLYVSSFIDGTGNPNCDHIRDIFESARNSAPCVLVLEGIDCVMKCSRSRECFLNELDTLASSNGILIIATSKKLKKGSGNDLLLQCSRFERKYEVLPPDDALRVRYIRNWFDIVESRKICSFSLENFRTERIVEQTAGWSFAQLKELFISFLLAINQKNYPVDTESIPTGGGDGSSDAENELLVQVLQLAKQNES